MSTEQHSIHSAISEDAGSAALADELWNGSTEILDKLYAGMMARSPKTKFAIRRDICDACGATMKPCLRYESDDE